MGLDYYPKSYQAIARSQGITHETFVVRRFVPEDQVHTNKTMNEFLSTIFMGRRSRIRVQDYWCAFDPEEDGGKGAWQAFTRGQLHH